MTTQNKKTAVTAVFDIGKTNKKFFLFNDYFQEVHKEYVLFDEITDEDGHPTENLSELKNWLKSHFNRILKSDKFDVKAINFSTYGATFVHIDENGQPLTPLYNYTKTLDQEIISLFVEKHGPLKELLRNTGCSNLSMLNSGLQLFWLKYKKPEIFQKIKYSLHFPQYLSYIFTGIPLSEYTSIGCHTLMWDYRKKDYHQWVYEEGLHKILPPIVSTETSINMNYNGKRIKIGVGIHDSSAALLPYLRSIKKEFLLVSTGTWSIVFNPFTSKPILGSDDKDIINYMRINGKPVRARRLFLGNEYKIQVKKLNEHFKLDNDFHRKIKFDYDTFLDLTTDFRYHYKWESIEDVHMPNHTILTFTTYERAYHQLMIELVYLQIKSIKYILDGTNIKHIYIDGGFSNNDLYINLLSHYFRDNKLRTTDASLGSALGAAISISDKKLNSKFLKKNYSLKKHVPFIIA